MVINPGIYHKVSTLSVIGQQIQLVRVYDTVSTPVYSQWRPSKHINRGQNSWLKISTAHHVVELVLSVRTLLHLYAPVVRVFVDLP